MFQPKALCSSISLRRSISSSAWSTGCYRFQTPMILRRRCLLSFPPPYDVAKPVMPLS